MANVTGASLGPIYSRLNDVPEYHPLEADTFADWSVEAGDIVTVTRGGNSYSSPVHQASMTWKRGQQVQLSATGKRQRDQLTKMSQQKFNRGGGGMRRQDYWHQYVTDMYGNIKSGIELTESHARIYAQDVYQQMKSELMLTESSAHLYSQNLYTQMVSGLKLTESSANLYTRDYYNRLEAGLSQTASSAVLYAASRTNRAYIMARINARGEGEALINADRIYLLGQTVAEQLSSYDVKVKSLSSARGGVNVYSVGTTSFTQGGISCYVPHAIENLRITSSGNTYYLQRKRFSDSDWVNVGNFSRAVSSWSVGGGSGKVSVTANPQKQTKSVPVSIGGSKSITTNGDYTYRVYYENDSGDDIYTGASMTVNVSVSSGSTYTSRTFKCTNITQVQGSTYRYTFTIDGRYNFSKNTNYSFYRTSW